ncbi:UNVERIFIED_CONTAM: Retrovirus-related Pol polyprotein from transposon opus [Sesamum latifolium]|uniref:Retrovirus-related Pol polyprotein from transposon opus n=1 Tax=Sesamum latifolium TaxID=2727402 RepID=A0AAW2WSA1_9LAMI
MQWLLKLGYIREIYYPEWISNVVLLPKPGGKWRMCVDFTDLNKACPKDSYPLPRIDLLVDSTSGSERLSMLDAYQGYNLIKLAKNDQEKTNFITERGLYCINIMPFGLKNVGATYQRMVNKIFAHQIGRNMKIYVDDMLVKSQQKREHLADLQEYFGQLQKFGVKLNPKKCVFGVEGGKFLGYFVTQRDIKANPDKIADIQLMTPRRTIKEVQKLAGRMAAFNRFISRVADRGLPFFKVLRNIKNFQWAEECSKAFHELKAYLVAPLLLSKPKAGEMLWVYLALSPVATSAVLTREERGMQLPVYYTSRMLQGVEDRYEPMEKLILALVHSAQKLWPYFLAHLITS